MHLNGIEDIDEVEGKRVLLRLDLNVPIKDGKVRSDFRIKKNILTLNKLLDKGAKVVIISHLGSDGSQSLKPVYEYLNKELKLEFIDSMHIDGKLIEKTLNISNSEAILLENLRSDPREIENDEEFAKNLSRLGDYYVNEAFSVSHREHTSIVALPKYLPSFAGINFLEEVMNLSNCLDPQKPLIIILGGAKIKTKLPLIKRFLNLAEFIFVFGAPAHNFFIAKGFEIGKSLIDSSVSVSEFLECKNIILPTDVVVRNGVEVSVKDISVVLSEDKILDAGEKSINRIKDKIKNAKTVIWNGPVGDFEKGFQDGTIELAKAIANTNVFSVVGGGDTISALEKLNLWNKFSFVSTGGGAMLQFLGSGTLPGIEALKSK